MIFALGSAAAWGISAFFGGRLSRTGSSAAQIVCVTHSIGFLLLLIAAPALGAASVATTDIGWGFLAGIGGTTGLVMLYRGFAVGRLSVVAPAAAIMTISIPALFGILTGGPADLRLFLGLACGLLAVVLLSRPNHRQPSPVLPPAVPVSQAPLTPSRIFAGGLLFALAAGTAFSTFSISIDMAGNGAGLWPLLGARTMSMLVLWPLVLSSGGAIGTVFAEFRRPLLLIGFLDLGGAVCFLLATQNSPLSAVVIVSAMYPAVTVVLARLILRERLALSQNVGVLSSLAGIALILSGG